MWHPSDYTHTHSHTHGVWPAPSLHIQPDARRDNSDTYLTSWYMVDTTQQQLFVLFFFIQLCPSVLILVDAKDSDSVQLRELWDQDAEQRRSIYHKVRSVVLGIKTCQKVAVKKQKKKETLKKQQQQHFTEAIQIQRCNDVL